MSKKYIFVTIATTLLLLGVLLLVIKNRINFDSSLLRPILGEEVMMEQTPTSSVTLEQPKAPKTFDFDSSTNLEAEFEKVNPQVLDSDFENL